MKIIYFTDWLIKNKIPVDIFLSQVIFTKNIKNYDQIKKIINSEYDLEYINKLLYWDGTVWPEPYDNHSYWQKMNDEWIKYINKKEFIGYRIKFCREGEITQNLKVRIINVKRSKIKKIKKLKI